MTPVDGGCGVLAGVAECPKHIGKRTGLHGTGLVHCRAVAAAGADRRAGGPLDGRLHRTGNRGRHRGAVCYRNGPGTRGPRHDAGARLPLRAFHLEGAPLRGAVRARAFRPADVHALVLRAFRRPGFRNGDEVPARFLSSAWAARPPRPAARRCCLAYPHRP